MCHKIRCDGKSWKLFGFQGELNNALASVQSSPEALRSSGLNFVEEGPKWIKALFRSLQKPKNFQDSSSHRILRRMHEVLNINDNKN